MPEEPNQPPHPVPPAHDPVPPANAAPVPPANLAPVPPANLAPVPPSNLAPVPPANLAPVPPAHNPPPPSHYPAPYPPQQEVYPPSSYQQEHQTYHSAAAVPPASHRTTPARRSATGRSATGRSATGRSATGRSAAPTKRPATYRRTKPAQESGISVFSVLLAMVSLGAIVLAIMILTPRDLSHISGYPADKMSNQDPRNILTDAQNILRTRTEDISFTEKEVNDYLNFRFKPSQGGPFGGLMKIQGIYIDLKKDQAEIFLERSIPVFGRNTVSTVILSDYNAVRRQQSWNFKGCSAGLISLPVSIQPILNLFSRMMAIAETEIEVMDYMANVRFEEDKIVFESAAAR